MFCTEWDYAHVESTVKASQRAFKEAGIKDPRKEVSMMEVHEEARKKLARDLHDGPTQSVAAMAMRINLTRRMFDKNEKMAKDELGKIEELAHRTTKEIRHMLFTLRPLILESQGLKAALQSMAEKMRETFSQNVVIDINEIPDLSPDAGFWNSARAAGYTYPQMVERILNLALHREGWR
jgi:signal transduction histidine kinase